MNKLFAPVAALAFVFSAAVAHADEATGTVASVDSYNLILEDGTTFTLGEGVMIENLQPGAEVTVSYEERDGQMVATEVAPSN